ncbi:xylulokinase [Deinococcus roseus]|uniref:Sugar kinase n=1 Tax=Deinococcus roseus TaxID=392414 RepID=A0ABQ2D000_9DEIO|nr:FGGY family carbohydrate kinase [Deinococcus roseus]GGJ36088.1 sugar kinase [Deinococcus roseus]
MHLGIDLGTGSIKVALFGEAGRCLRQGSRSYAILSPQKGWAETNPWDWWVAAGETVLQVVGHFGPSVKSIGLSGQMHGVVLTSREGNPLKPAILWADQRSSITLEAYRHLPESMGSALRNPVVPGMAGPILLWLKSFESAVYHQARWALQPKDWLCLQLTGHVHTDPSDLSGTLLSDPAHDHWNFELLKELGLREDLFPPVLPSRALGGTLLPSAARHLGLPEGIPVAVGAADTAAALLGTGLPEGQLQLTIGTGAQLVLKHQHLPDTHPTLQLYRTAEQRGWYSMAALQNAGLALEWVRSVLRLDWPTFYTLAEQAPAGSKGLVFLPHLTGSRTPHPTQANRGGWMGLGLEHDLPCMARSAFEGVALSITQGLQVMPPAQTDMVRLAGGGTTHPWWQQLLADLLQKPLEVIDTTGASARGAALLGEAAMKGQHPQFAQAQIAQTVLPNPEFPHQHLLERFGQAFQQVNRPHGPRPLD